MFIFYNYFMNFKCYYCVVIVIVFISGCLIFNIYIVFYVSEFYLYINFGDVYT